MCKLPILRLAQREPRFEVDAVHPRSKDRAIEHTLYVSDLIVLRDNEENDRERKIVLLYVSLWVESIREVGDKIVD